MYLFLEQKQKGVLILADIQYSGYILEILHFNFAKCSAQSIFLQWLIMEVIVLV